MNNEIRSGTVPTGPGTDGPRSPHYVGGDRGTGSMARFEGTKLREYQSEAVHETLKAWGCGMKRPALLMATGLGKTVIFAELSRLMATSAGRRPVVLVHRDELVRQSVAKLKAADPKMRIGIIQGRDMGIARTDIVVASVQTLSRPNRLAAISRDRFDLIIVDECHHAMANSYRAILDHFGAFDSAGRTLCLGVTATMARGDGQGLGQVWDDVVLERDIRFGVENGYLTPAEVRTVRLAGLDTDRVRAGIDGDLAAGALARAMSNVHAGPIIAKAYAEFGRGADGRLRRAAVFCPTVDVALAWQADFLEVGARTAVITGKTPVEERQTSYARLEAGRLDALLTVMVLTEGWDCPAVEVAVVARPTKSMPLLTQIVGRVLRPSPDTGKRAALVIDVVGSMGSGLARSLDLSIPEPLEQIAPLEGEFPEELLAGMPPEPPLPIPAIDWVAIDLHGEPIPKAERRRGHAGPEWLRTYQGVPFLAPTVEFPDLLFVMTRQVDGEIRGPWWIKRKSQAPEQLFLSEGADLRDIHPGVKPTPGMVLATDKQTALLRRLVHPLTRMALLGPDTPRPAARLASDLLSVHFASRELDRPIAVVSPIGRPV